MTVVIDKAGVYDIPTDVYHADPVPGGSLSSTGARKLLPPSCPALFAYDREHGRPPKAEFDFGHAAHKHALGAGAPLVVVNAPDWRTKAAREKRDEARAAGHTPVLTAEYEVVVDMAKALLEHPAASGLFRPGCGKPERSLFWVDEGTGVWCRAMLDWLPYFTVYDREGQPTTGRGYPGRVIVPDYKTCRSAAPDELQRVISAYGYHQQADWYLQGIRALWHVEAKFVFVFQEKTPPYLVTVAEPDATAMQIGRRLNREALLTYRECTESGHWRGYSDDVEMIPLPGWVERQYAGEIW